MCRFILLFHLRLLHLICSQIQLRDKIGRELLHDLLPHPLNLLLTQPIQIFSVILVDSIILTLVNVLLLLHLRQEPLLVSPISLTLLLNSRRINFYHSREPFSLSLLLLSLFILAL